MRTQDKIERAVYDKMLDGLEFFDAVETVEADGIFEVEGCGGWSADVTVEGITYELDADWITRRHYPQEQEGS